MAKFKLTLNNEKTQDSNLSLLKISIQNFQHRGSFNEKSYDSPGLCCLKEFNLFWTFITLDFFAIRTFYSRTVYRELQESLTI